MYSIDELFQRSREGYLGELRSNDGNKYQNNIRVSAGPVHHESTYIVLFLTRHKESINNLKN